MPRGSLNHEPDKSTTLYTHFKTWSWSLTTMKVVRTGGGGGGLPYISHTGMYASKGRVFGHFWSENTSLILVWIRGNYGSVHV